MGVSARGMAHLQRWTAVGTSQLASQVAQERKQNVFTNQGGNSNVLPAQAALNIRFEALPRH